MNPLGFWILIIIGILKIIFGIVYSSQHGKPKNEKYNAPLEVFGALMGVVFILIAYEVI